MNLIEYYERNVKNASDTIFIKYKSSSISYQESAYTVENIRSKLKNFNEDIIIINTEHMDILVLAILACIYEKKCYYILSQNTPEMRKKYIFKTLSVTRYIELSENGDVEIKNYTANTGDIKKIDIKSSSAQIIFTSGSTGRPKGVCLTYNNINNFAADIDEYFDFTNTEGMISLSDPSFDMFVSEIIISIVKNKILYLVGYERLMDIEYIVNIIKDNRIQNILTTPSKLDMITQKNCNKLELKNILLGGEKLKKDLVDRLLNDNSSIQLFNLYGPTETTFHCLRFQVSCSDNILLGTPVKNNEVFVLNDLGNLCKTGRGKLVVIGESVTDGYLGYISDDFISHNNKRGFITSDIVNIDSMHNIEYLDRESSIFKINGQRISFDEIENSIQACSNIDFIKVLYYEEQLIALYQTKLDININTLRENLEKFIPQYMIPNNFYKITEREVNQNGKLDYNAMLDKILNKNKPLNNNVTEKNEIEVIICKVLKKEIDKTLSLSQNGGNSLSAMRIIMELRSIGVNLSAKDLLKNIPICELFNKKNIEKNIEIVDKSAKFNLTPIQELMLLNNNNNVDKFTTSHVFKLSENVPVNAIHNFFKSLISKYDGLRMYYNKEEDMLNLSNSSNIFIYEYELSEFNKTMLEPIFIDLSSKCTLNELETFIVSKVSCGNESYLIMLLHHFFSDALSWKIIHDELEMHFYQGLQMQPFRDEYNYSHYLTNIQKNSNAYDQGFISNILDNENYHSKKSNDLYNILDFNEYLCSIPSDKIIDESMFYTSIIFALNEIESYVEKLFEIEDNGRIINGMYYYESIGWHTSPFNIMLGYDKLLSKQMNKELIYDKINLYKKHATQLARERVKNLNHNFLGAQPSIVLNYLGSIGDIEKEFQFNAKEDLLVKFDLYIVSYYKNDSFFINFKYNNKYSKEAIMAISHEILEFINEQ